MPIHMAGAVLPAVACATKVSHKKAPGAISAIAFIVRPVNPNVGCISGAVFSAIESLLVIDERPRKGQNGRTIVVRLYFCIVPATPSEGKRKILITEISVLYALRLIAKIKSFDARLRDKPCDCAMLSPGARFDFMKIAGFFLLVAGWLLVVAALVLLHRSGPRALFTLAGVAVELL